MLIEVDPNSGVPAYRQIVDQIRFQVLSGVLRPGDELPSTRNLSQELGLNPMTVSKCYGLLEAEGVLQRRPGLPLIVAQRDQRRLAHARAEELRALLEPAATAIRQLGIEPSRAAETLRELLDTASHESGADR